MNYLKDRISYLLVAGHSGANGMMGEKGGTKYRFTAEQLLALSEEPTFNRAKQKKGPVRCWFTKNANAVFPGCNSEDVMAHPMAKKILRKGGTKAWGTNQLTGWGSGKVYYNYDHDHWFDTNFSMWGSNSSNWQNPVIWTSFSGEQ